MDAPIANVIVARRLHLESEYPDVDIALHQLPRGLGVRRTGHLRHHAVHRAGRADDLRRGPAAQVQTHLERDRFVTPEQAVEYGLVDSVIGSRAPVPRGRTGFGS